MPAGRVGRPHGLDGSFYVTRPVTPLLGLGSTVQVAGREAEIVRRAGTAEHPILRLAGVEDRDAAEELRGAELTVEQDRLPELGEGEWWAHELAGCMVRDGDHEVGVVTGLLELPSCEALEVRRSDAPGTLLVPLVKDAIRSVAPQRRAIDIDLSFLEEEPPRAPQGGGRR
ncbi:MAG TPA: ribosome maturation factor RimM [Solirubrobacteraceae bacterium]|nr:ribosome maturation factor RimM [Solirubrobacteraceae bacterium]